MEESWFEVKVVYKMVDDETGKITKKPVKKLVRGYEMFDIATKLAEAHKGYTGEWWVHSHTRTTIDEIIE